MNNTELWPICNAATILPRKQWSCKGRADDALNQSDEVQTHYITDHVSKQLELNRKASRFRIPSQWSLNTST